MTTAPPAAPAVPAPPALPDGSRRPRPPAGFRALLTVMATTPTGALRGRRLLGLAVLVGLPLIVQTLLLIFAEGRGSGFGSFAQFTVKAYLTVIIPLVAVFLGTAVLGDEWEGGTAHWVVGQPLSRGVIVAGRVLITAVRALLLVLPALLLLYLLALAPHAGAVAHYLPALGVVLGVVILMVLGYASIFVCLGVALRRSVMTSLVYVLVLDGFVSNLPSGFSALSLAFHARNLLWNWTGEQAFEPALMRAMEIVPTSSFESLLTVGIFMLFWTALATWALRRKEVGSGGPTVESSTT